MGYSFRRRDATVQDGIRRIAVEQIDRALAEIDDETLEAADTVHQVRKRCKKLRGLIRLVRPAFDGYAAENAAFRDAARPLSVLRDADALIETYDAVAGHFADEIDRRAFGPIRRRLTLNRNALAEAHDPAALLAAFREEMTAARERAAEWRLSADGFDAIGGGLAKTAKRASKAFDAAGEDPRPDRLHDWRKRVKYHWYHTRLLERVWPGPMAAHRAEADRLGDLLGDHHDIAVFRAAFLEDPDSFAPPGTLTAWNALMERRQAVLTEEAFALGARLMAEAPGDLAGRWERYWDVWRAGRTPAGRAIAA